MTECPLNYDFNYQTNLCQHYIFPFTSSTAVGLLLTFILAGLASLSGIGGGTPNIVLLMIFYNYSPKSSTIMVFCCILGTTLGNVFSQMRKKINGEPLIQYHFAFVSIPILFTGTIIGVLLNRLLPSIIICLLCMYWVTKSIKDIYRRFLTSYSKQTQQKSLKQIDCSRKYIQSACNPLQSPRQRYILKNLFLLFLTFIIFTLIKGTQKLDSIIGVTKCSSTYWMVYAGMFVTMIWFSRWNLNTLKAWEVKPILLSDQCQNSGNNLVEKNIKLIGQRSFLAGILSGMGRAGGYLLIPMYKQLNCTSIQAAATCAFTIFSSSLLNVIQGILLGVINLNDFVVLFLTSFLGSITFSTFVLKYLQKINRVSIIQCVLLAIICIALVNLPIALYHSYSSNGYDINILIGFGSLC